MKDKLKNRIEKLLNLSMSNNENEASLALEKALALMNEHNITEDEVYRQKFIKKEILFEVFILPEWMVKLNSSMAEVSGCIFTWRNGYKYKNVKVKGSITGRERDVQNAVYLIEFLSREIANKAKVKKKELSSRGASGSVLANFLKGYKIGIIRIVFIKLYKQQNKFFNQQVTEGGLVCVDIESKVQSSEDFLNGKFNLHVSKAKENEKAIQEGIKDGSEININQAVSKQKETKQLGVL